MTTNSISHVTDTAEALVTKWGDPVVLIPRTYVSAGMDGYRPKPLVTGDRYALILRQEPSRTASPEALYADHLSVMSNFAPENLIAGYQWTGEEGPDDPHYIAFTIIGIYELVDEVPTGGRDTIVRFRNVEAPPPAACSKPDCTGHVPGDEGGYHSASEDSGDVWEVRVLAFSDTEPWRVYGQCKEHERHDEEPGLYAEDVAAFVAAYGEATALAGALNAKSEVHA